MYENLPKILVVLHVVNYCQHLQPRGIHAMILSVGEGRTLRALNREGRAEEGGVKGIVCGNFSLTLPNPCTYLPSFIRQKWSITFQLLPNQVPTGRP